MPNPHVFTGDPNLEIKASKFLKAKYRNISQIFSIWEMLIGVACT